MKNLVFLFLSSLIFFNFLNCNKQLIRGKGKIVTTTVSVSPFNAIKLMGSATVEVTKGDKLEVKAQDYENIVEYLKVEVKNNKLTIGGFSNMNIYNSKAKVLVTTPHDITNLSVNGSGDIIVKSRFDNVAKAEVLGSGDILAEVESNTCCLTINVKGSGDVNLKTIRAESATCNIMGSGDVTIRVSETLKANITGSGDIIYYGSPSKVRQNVMGSGDLIKR